MEVEFTFVDLWIVVINVITRLLYLVFDGNVLSFFFLFQSNLGLSGSGCSEIHYRFNNNLF